MSLETFARSLLYSNIGTVITSLSFNTKYHTIERIMAGYIPSDPGCVDSIKEANALRLELFRILDEFWVVDRGSPLGLPH